jgi:hypothetical protein
MTSRPGSGRDVDFIEVVLLATAVSALLAAVSMWGQATTSGRRIWVLVTAAMIAVLGLVWRSRTARDPFIPAALSRQRGYVPAALAAVALGVYLAVEILVPLQVAALNDLGTGAIGLVLLPGAVLAVVVATPAGRAADRAGHRFVAAVGVLAMVVAVAALSSSADKRIADLEGGTPRRGIPGKDSCPSQAGSRGPLPPGEWGLCATSAVSARGLM